MSTIKNIMLGVLTPVVVVEAVAMAVPGSRNAILNNMAKYSQIYQDVISEKTALEKAKEEQEEKIIDLGNTIVTLNASLADCNSRLEVVTSEKATLQNQLSQKDVEMQNLISQKHELETSIEQLTADKTEAQNKVVELQGQIDTLSAEKQTLSDELETANSTVATLQANIETLTAQKTALENALATSEGDKETLQTELDNVNAELASKQTELDTANQTISTLQTSISEKDAQIESKQSELDTANETIASKQTEIDNLTVQLQEKQSEIATLTSDKQALEAQVSDLNTQMSALNASISDLTAEKNKLITQKSIIGAELQIVLESQEGYVKCDLDSYSHYFWSYTFMNKYFGYTVDFDESTQTAVVRRYASADSTSPFFTSAPCSYERYGNTLFFFDGLDFGTIGDNEISFNKINLNDNKFTVRINMGLPSQSAQFVASQNTGAVEYIDSTSGDVVNASLKLSGDITSSVLFNALEQVMGENSVNFSVISSLTLSEAVRSVRSLTQFDSLEKLTIKNPNIVLPKNLVHTNCDLGIIYSGTRSQFDSNYIVTDLLGENYTFIKSLSCSDSEYVGFELGDYYESDNYELHFPRRANSFGKIEYLEPYFVDKTNGGLKLHPHSRFVNDIYTLDNSTNKLTKTFRVISDSAIEMTVNDEVVTLTRKTYTDVLQGDYDYCEYNTDTNEFVSTEPFIHINISDSTLTIYHDGTGNLDGNYTNISFTKPENMNFIYFNTSTNSKPMYETITAIANDMIEYMGRTYKIYKS